MLLVMVKRDGRQLTDCKMYHCAGENMSWTMSIFILTSSIHLSSPILSFPVSLPHISLRYSLFFISSFSSLTLLPPSLVRLSYPPSLPPHIAIICMLQWRGMQRVTAFKNAIAYTERRIGCTAVDGLDVRYDITFHFHHIVFLLLDDF